MSTRRSGALPVRLNYSHAATFGSRELRWKLDHFVTLLSPPLLTPNFVALPSCSCHHLQISLSTRSFLMLLLRRSLASLHWPFSAVVKSCWELITFVILCVLIRGRALRLKQQTQASGKLGITPGLSAVGAGREDWTASQIICQYMLMILCFFCGNALR